MAEVYLGGEPSGIIKRLETSMLTSWPALSTAFDGDWVLRLADGMTNRSNSVTCLGDSPLELEQRIDRVETIYEDRRLPPTFRISPLAPSALTGILDRRGWRRFDESIVMTLDLADTAFGDQRDLMGVDLKIAAEPSTVWFDACRQIDQLSHAEATTLGSMLERLIPDAGYGRLQVDDQVAALALAVIDVELVGLFEVMTAENQRRKGFSRLLLSHLLRFGQERGAAKGWLAVAADNEPAVNLYRSLGFSEVYRYHYRSKG